MTEADPHKKALFSAWRAHLESRLDVLRPEQDAARAGTRVDGDHRPSNRGERGAVTTQGYLAGALAQRIADLEEALALLDRMDPTPRRRVAMGAQVEIEDEQGHAWSFAFLPAGQGDRLTVAGHAIVVVSPQSPVGAALLGKQSGDEAVWRRAGTATPVEIVTVS